MTYTFNGGIQTGTVATDARARKLDEQCKYTRNTVLPIISAIYPGVTMQKKLTSAQIPGGKGACVPDGGLWFYKSKLIAAFEGKKQQDRGNAIERWFKNNYICREINPFISYVTFCTGEGAYPDGTIGKALNVAHLEGFDKYNPGDNSAFFNVDCFTSEFISDIMLQVLSERIQSTNLSQ